MVSGNQIRLNRILKKGRMLCIPMDHGISNGPIEGLENPANIIYKCENHGLTSVIINKGIIKTMPKPSRVGILVHFSSSTSLSLSPNRKMLTGTVKEAVALGADGVSLHINIGGKEEPEIQIFKNALDFSKVKLRDCMVPRTEIVALSIDDTINTLKEKFVATGLSKILVYRNNIENIIGYTHSFEMFNNPDSITSILLPISLVPESMSANKMLSTFLKQQRSIAVVIDEFGGVAGIVTIEDVIEEIVGEIDDEYDKQELLEQKINDQEYLLAGRLEISYLNDKYNLELPVSEDYETLSGLITHHHESIPRLNEVIKIGAFQFSVTKVNETRIENTSQYLIYI